jgi:hypothetical protein
MRFGRSEGKGIDIPVFKQDSVFHTDYVCGNHRPPDAREPAVDDDEVSLGYDCSGLILERRRGALDQIEETVTARLNVCAVLSVVGRPEALRCRIISLIKQGSRKPPAQSPYCSVLLNRSLAKSAAWVLGSRLVLHLHWSS